MTQLLRKALPLLVIGAVLLAGQLALSQGGDDTAVDTGSADRPAATADAEAIQEVDDGIEPHVAVSDLPTVSLDALPIEAIDTITLIDAGGPYPFDRDDLVFQNREGLLPDRPLGHYREYTVITPGENDRGARRVVAGADGEMYYTADHYRSFEEITLTLAAG